MNDHGEKTPKTVSEPSADSPIWVAYCDYCSCEVEERLLLAEAEVAARQHMEENPDHSVLVGYWVKTTL